MGNPLVSIVVPAYNSMPYVTQCLESTLSQTIGLDEVEVIAVDDGSTDGTGEELDRIAAGHPKTVHIVHQPNSGGPGGPRNVGLSMATGRYVFFLDADDYLGPEALERMCGMADAHDSDVLLARMASVNGRGVPQSMFKENQPVADLYRSRVYWSLSPQKMFRRSHLERHGLRFPEGIGYGEDQPFVAKAMIRARVISVIADYDCIYHVKRDDGQNQTNTTYGVRTRLESFTRMVELLDTELPPGRNRDYLIRRHMDIGLQALFRNMCKEKDPRVRRDAFELVRPRVVEWTRGRVAKGMHPYYRTQWALIRDGQLDAILHQVRIENGWATGEYPLGFDPDLLENPSLRLRWALSSLGWRVRLRRLAKRTLRSLGLHR